MLENEIHSQVVDSMNSLGYDIENSIELINAQLLADGYISEVSGEQLKTLLAGLPSHNSNVLYGLLSDSVRSEFLIYSSIFNQKIKMVDSLELDRSVWGKKIKILTPYFDSMSASADIDIEKAQRFILSTMSEEDLDHSPYSIMAHALLINFSDVPTGLQVELPPISNQPNGPTKVKSKYVLKITLDQNDIITVNQEKEELYSVKKLAIKHIVKFENKAIISLRNYRGTSYDAYVKVYNEITAAYIEVREDYSNDKFGKSYNKLSMSEQKQVKEKYPKKLVESEPVSSD